jgi:hypothetical protein
MMDTKQNKLDQFKGKQPFKLPDNYMDGLTQQIMDNIPESVVQTEEPVTLMMKLRPFLYMTAMIAGMVFILKLLIGDAANKMEPDSSKNNISQTENKVGVDEMNKNDSADLEFLEYIEDQYSDAILKEELAFYD